MSALIWFIIIGCLIKLSIDFIRGIPNFLQKSRLQYEEEKWRKQKENEFLQHIEWLKITPQIYENKKLENPYRKDNYYNLPPDCREFFNRRNHYLMRDI